MEGVGGEWGGGGRHAAGAAGSRCAARGGCARVWRGGAGGALSSEVGAEAVRRASVGASTPCAASGGWRCAAQAARCAAQFGGGATAQARRAWLPETHHARRNQRGGLAARGRALSGVRCG